MTKEKTTFIKFKEPKTLAEALNWVKDNYEGFDTMTSGVQIWKTAHCGGFKMYLDYINGRNFNGKKIYKNSQADWERNRFASTRITHFAIHEHAFITHYELYDKYGFEYTMTLPLFKDGYCEIEILEI